MKTIGGVLVKTIKTSLKINAESEEYLNYSYDEDSGDYYNFYFSIDIPQISVGTIKDELLEILTRGLSSKFEICWKNLSLNYEVDFIKLLSDLKLHGYYDNGKVKLEIKPIMLGN
jgi:hypothetical protein